MSSTIAPQRDETHSKVTEALLNGIAKFEGMDGCKNVEIHGLAIIHEYVPVEKVRAGAADLGNTRIPAHHVKDFLRNKPGRWLNILDETNSYTPRPATENCRALPAFMMPTRNHDEKRVYCPGHGVAYSLKDGSSKYGAFKPREYSA